MGLVRSLSTAYTHSNYNPNLRCHPYYDPVIRLFSFPLIRSHPLLTPCYLQKSDSINPRWYMIDLTFSSRAKHFIPLALFRFIANYSSLADLPEELAYIGAEGLKAIKSIYSFFSQVSIVINKSH